MTSVLQPWVESLTLMQQSVIISACRGCDGLSKNDVSKSIVRIFRVVTQIDAKPKALGHSFMSYGDKNIVILVKDLVYDIDKYPIHFIMHLMHGIEIVGYKHPEEKVREAFFMSYNKISKSFHLNPETEEQLDERLNS
jgi:hypothetical protein